MAFTFGTLGLPLDTLGLPLDHALAGTFTQNCLLIHFLQLRAPHKEHNDLYSGAAGETPTGERSQGNARGPQGTGEQRKIARKIAAPKPPSTMHPRKIIGFESFLSGSSVANKNIIHACWHTLGLVILPGRIQAKP